MSPVQARLGPAWQPALGVLGLLAVSFADGPALAGRRVFRPELGPGDHAIGGHEIELAPVIVDPTVAGPTIQPSGGLPRAPSTVRDALGAIRPRLVECYRWARFRQPGLGTATFRVDMRFDAAGSVRRVAVEPPSSIPDGGARACLREILGTVSVALYTSRVTDVAFTLRLSPSGQGRPRRAPARPRRAARATLDPPGRCSAAVAPVVDRLQLEDEQIDDFSVEQSRQERLEQVRRDHRAWVRGGRVGPEPVVEPDVVAGCANVRGAFTPAALTRAIVANAGAYADCFAAFDQQAPPARADVAVDVGGEGRFCSAHVVGSVDSRLARCLESAIDDVWLPSALGGQPVHVIVALVRGAASVPAPAAPGPTCAQSVAELQRRLAGSPWLADPPLFAIADAIRADAERTPRTADRDGCWRGARDLVAGAVTSLHKDARALQNQDLMQAVIAGYDWLLGQRPALSDDVTLRFYRAEALWTVQRWTDAARAYVDVRERDAQGRYAKDAAYAAVLAWVNAIDRDAGSCCAAESPGRRPPIDGATAASRSLSAEETGLVSAIDGYLQLIPDAPDAAALMKRKADLLAWGTPNAAGP